MAAKAAALNPGGVTADEKRRLLYLLLVALVVLAAGMGLRAPWPPDEPRFALIARDMVENGQWLLPHVGGVLYPDKPPLFFWLVACFYAVTGSIDIALLIPGLASGLVVLFLVADLGRRLWDADTGLWCAATLLAMVQFPWQMRGGQIDALLCLWTTLGLYGFLRHLLDGPDWRWYATGGAAAGLGVITKGVGFLPYLVFVPMLVTAGSSWSYQGAGWRDARWLLAPIATLSVICAWLVPMLVVTELSGEPAYMAYRDNILFHQTVTRYADSWGHIKPPWYLLTHAVIPLWMPVTLMLPWLVPAWRRDLIRRHLPTLLLLSWVALLLLFFSLSDGKRGVYIFPAAPAVALLAGRHMRELLQRKSARLLLLAWTFLVATILVIFALLVLNDPGLAAGWLSGSSVAFNAALVVLSIGGAMLVALYFLGRNHALRGIAASLVIFWAGLGLLLAPVLDGVRSGRTLMRLVGQEVPGDIELGLVDWPEQFLLQADRPLYHFGYRRPPEQELADGMAWLRRDRARVLLLPDTLVSACFDSEEVRFVGRAHRRNWVLASSASLVEGCGEPLSSDPLQIVFYAPPGLANDLDQLTL